MAESSGMIQALRPVIVELEQLGVRYYVGGSVASSHHGVARNTLDVDLNVELNLKIAARFIQPLQADYYVSESAMQDAIRRKSCFNLLHHSTGWKIDLFVSRDRPFDRSALQRAKIDVLGDHNETLEARVATPEDIILLKFDWFRLGDYTSERQWSDLKIVAKLYKEHLDKDYLHHWSKELHLDDLWAKLQLEANL